MAEGLKTLPLHELQKRKSVKWRRFPADVLPLPIAEMDFEIAEPIKSALRDMIDRSDTGYLETFPELFEAFTEFSRDRWSWEIDMKQIRIVTDVGVGVVEVLRTLISVGEKIMINSPVYDNMWNWGRELHAEIVPVPLKEDNLEYSIDLESIEAGYRSGVKVHILCHPHNPVGIIYSKDELAAIAALAVKYGVIVISDEIHGPLTFAGQQFTPFLAVSNEARECGIIITSASKAFNLAGLKCALIITDNQVLNDRIKALPNSLAFRASLFGAAAAAAAFGSSGDWLDRCVVTLDENRQLLKNLIEAKIPTIGYRIPDFGYLAWLDLSKLDLGTDPCATILERGRVAINSGSMYGPRHSQFGRFNFGTSPEIITEAVDRIVRAL